MTRLNLNIVCAVVAVLVTTFAWNAYAECTVGCHCTRWAKGASSTLLEDVCYLHDPHLEDEGGPNICGGLWHTEAGQGVKNNVVKTTVEIYEYDFCNTACVGPEDEAGVADGLKERDEYEIIDTIEVDLGTECQEEED